MTRNQITFEMWLNRVSAEIEKISGLSRDDIADYEYYASWEAGDSPATCARYALEAADFPFDSDEDEE